MLAGLPGTGKTTLAQALVERLNAVAIDKDRVRAALFPGAATDYTAAQNSLCMDAMLSAAEYLVTHQQPQYIIFDGRTFSRAAQIEQVIAAAKKVGARWAIIVLECSEAVARQRLALNASKHPAHDRNISLYLRIKSEFEPIVRPALRVDTSDGVGQILPTVLEFLLEQAEEQGEQI
ncbi:putative kinase [Acidipila rosea]|uniref:Putative kinase n=2 Tax=Acidipila rosea TaxID=768535 RepID=A0A4R1KXT2_9BACT|nr:putative kinase [Acidipila rosea]